MLDNEVTMEVEELGTKRWRNKNFAELLFKMMKNTIYQK
jgi:hypothetical protein